MSNLRFEELCRILKTLEAIRLKIFNSASRAEVKEIEENIESLKMLLASK